MIYGLDLSLTSTGVVIMDNSGEIQHLSTIKPRNKDSTPKRLHYIRNTLKRLAQEFPPDIIVIERGFTRFNKATQQLYRVHGIVNELFYDVKQVYITPKAVKKEITGNGNANKQDVMDAVNEIYDLDIKEDDITDALALIHVYNKEG